MEFSKKIANQDSKVHSDSSNLDLRSIVDKYLSHWKWFLLSITILCLNTFWSLNFTRSSYEANASIKIKDEGGADKSTLSVFQDLGMGNGQDNIEDEIEILSSKSLVSEAVKSLRLNIQYYTDKNYISEFVDEKLNFHTEFYERERYRSKPLNITFLIPDSTLFSISTNFFIEIVSVDNYVFHDFNRSIQKRHAFGEKITTNFGDIIVTPSGDLKKSGLIGETVLISINSVRGMTNSYVDRLNVEPVSKFSNVLSLTISDTDRWKAEDFLNELVKKYNQRAVGLKEALSDSTAAFVTRRLTLISQELSVIDLSAESLKTRYQLSDVASETGLNMQMSQELENQRTTTEAQLSFD